MKKLIKRFKHWWRTRVLREVTVLDILEYANKHRRYGLCWSFDDACYYYGVYCHDFECKCRRFNIDEAMRFNTVNDSGWWWDKGEWGTGREEFLKYLIDYYSSTAPILLTAV